MLMVAQKLARDGKTVLVVSRKGEVGGAWRTVSLENGLEAEAACHLIEPIPNVYEVFEKYSGTQFVPQTPLPCRSLNAKWLLQYTGFVNRMLTYFSLLVAAVVCGFRWLIGKPDPMLDIKFAKAQTALGCTVAYFAGGGAVKVPQSGYARFVGSLHSVAQAAGVEFLEAELKEIEVQGEVMRLNCGETLVRCRHLEVTSSVLLQEEPGVLRPMQGMPVERTSVFVKFSSRYIRRPFSYITFSGKAPLKRMCMLDVPGSDSTDVYVLLELPSGVLWKHSNAHVSEYLVKAGFFREVPLIETLFERVEELAWTFASSGHRQRDSDRVRYWNSRGNLADGIYRYRRFLSLDAA